MKTITILGKEEKNLVASEAKAVIIRSTRRTKVICAVFARNKQ